MDETCEVRLHVAALRAMVSRHRCDACPPHVCEAIRAMLSAIDIGGAGDLQTLGVGAQRLPLGRGRALLMSRMGQQPLSPGRGRGGVCDGRRGDRQGSRVLGPSGK